MKRRKSLVALVTAAAVAASAAAVVAADPDPDNSKEIQKAISGKTPENVILIIGDGAGDSELTIGRYYLNGALGAPLAYETLPFAGHLHTWNLQYGEGPDYAPNHVPDSAPTATAWSTGKKTTDGRLSQGPSTAEDVPGANEGFETTFEIMKARGKAVGNVTTSELTDATPAAPSAHISKRGCQGPEDARESCPLETKAAGGLGSIAEQQVDHLLDVNLGGGRGRWEQTLDDGSGTVLDAAAAQGFRDVSDAAGLDAITSLEDGPVLGLFTDRNMKAALEFPAENPETLVVVTADHSHTSQIIGSDSEPADSYATLQTADGAPMRVA